MNGTLQRETFTTSRVLEFFSEKELQMQIGYATEGWPVALVKELIDNALDACEQAGVAPEIEISLEADTVSVRDNGPGLPDATLRRSLDYLVRVSDKSYYVSPTRGQLGNALKCVWAAPFVVSGSRGVVEVVTGGVAHRIDVSLDRIAQEPRLLHTTGPDGVVKNGTLVRLHWPGIASYLGQVPNSSSYKPDLPDLVGAYSAWNPHAHFTLRLGDEEGEFPPSCPDWRKWRPQQLTSPHWYTVERLRALIGAYLAEEQNGARTRTVRELVAEFGGLSGTAKQKAVTDAAGLTGLSLRDLAAGGEVAREPVARLLAAMQAEARPVKPAALGCLGEEHLWETAAWYNADPESIRYRKIEGEADGLPFVLEVAFGIYTEEYAKYCGEIEVGLNWSPTLRQPLLELSRLLGENRVDSWDPVVLLVHLASPRLEFLDRGKTQLALPAAIRDALARAVTEVTRPWKEAKRRADRNDRLRQRDLEDLRKAERRKVLSVKEAAYQVMEQAYLKASAGGRLPANARQVMYAARPLVLSLTGGRGWKNSAYFTQHLLPDFIEEHPELTASWDVVFDARGHLIEPHTQQRTDLGTLAVRRYLQEWTTSIPADREITLAGAVPTRGPANRYRFALFIEKEGFHELLAEADIADRFDLALMSTKGMSVTAARHLVERLSEAGVTVLVLRDFDKAGFSIVHTLTHDTRRYRFRTQPRVLDLGLRLDDVEAMDLESEPVEYDGAVDPREKLGECGATEDECDFLVRRQVGGKWLGERVELNAMDSGQFVEWLEEKLAEAGVEKVVPDAAALEQAWQRARRRAAAQKAIDAALRSVDDTEIPLPADLADRLREELEDTGESWDTVLWNLALRDSEEA